jgi:hypothetical protein
MLSTALALAGGVLLAWGTGGCSGRIGLSGATDASPSNREAGAEAPLEVAVPVATSTIGELVDTVDRLKFNVNILDGFAGYENDTYVIDTASGHLDYTHVTGSMGNTTTDAVDATPEQVTALVAVVRAATWRVQRELSECPGQSYVFVDGQSSAPGFLVTTGQQELGFGVSDASCATSKHSAHGMVISDHEWNLIFDSLLAIRPGGNRPFDNGW